MSARHGPCLFDRHIPKRPETKGSSTQSQRPANSATASWVLKRVRNHSLSWMSVGLRAVSYTHLTLPTICSV
eukprot:8988431-Alexandrium_andersonii.AAC.1